MKKTILYGLVAVVLFSLASCLLTFKYCENNYKNKIKNEHDMIYISHMKERFALYDLLKNGDNDKVEYLVHTLLNGDISSFSYMSIGNKYMPNICSLFTMNYSEAINYYEINDQDAKKELTEIFERCEYFSYIRPAQSSATNTPTDN